MRMTYKKAKTTLPSSIEEKMASLYSSDLQYSRAVSMLRAIMRRVEYSELSLHDYVSIPSNYWKTIAEHYEVALNPLVRKGILQRKPYSVEKGTCFKYRINPILWWGDPVTVTYKVQQRKRSDCELCRATMRTLRRTKLDLVGAKKRVDRYIDDSEYQDAIVVAPSLDSKEAIKINMSMIGGGTKYCSAKSAKDIADQRGYSILKDGRNYVMCNPRDYLKRKRSYVKNSYYSNLYKYASRYFYSKRNKTNKRLDHNLTNMPSILLPFFKLDGEPLVSIDLKNSQFCILSACISSGNFNYFIDLWNSASVSERENQPSFKPMKNYITCVDSISEMRLKPGYVDNGPIISALSKYYYLFQEREIPVFPDDLERFREFAKNGQLYEHMQSKLGLGSGAQARANAKMAMFEIFFSSRRSSSSTKKGVKELFPSLVFIIDAFKKALRDNEFSIYLQKIESYIFIDRILYELSRERLNVLTKHDSILCKKSEAARVEEIVREVLDAELRDYKLSVENLV